MRVPLDFQMDGRAIQVVKTRRRGAPNVRTMFPPGLHAGLPPHFHCRFMSAVTDVL